MGYSETLDVGQLTLTGAAQQLLPAYTEGAESVIIKPHAANTGRVYLGKSGVATTTGFELPNEGVVLDYRRVADLHVIGTAADKVGYLVLR